MKIKTLTTTGAAFALTLGMATVAFAQSGVSTGVTRPGVSTPGGMTGPTTSTSTTGSASESTGVSANPTPPAVGAESSTGATTQGAGVTARGATDETVTASPRADKAHRMDHKGPMASSGTEKKGDKDGTSNSSTGPTK